MLTARYAGHRSIRIEEHQPDPPSASIDRTRKTDAERPQRRTETGGWSRRPAAS